MNRSKQTSELVDFISGTEESSKVQVVIELKRQRRAAANSTLSKSERLAARRSEFEDDAKRVLDRIREVGGEVDAAVWLNDTVYATVGRSALSALEELDEVDVLDLPGEVTFDH